MMFRETGIVVAVMSTIPHADTRALALKVGEAFAQPERRYKPAGQTANGGINHL